MEEVLFNYTYYTIPVVAFVVVVSLILNDVIKRAEVADEVVAVSMFRFNFELVSFFMMMVVWIATVASFVTSYDRAYSVLVPDYFTYWYELLWLDNVKGFVADFAGGEMFSEVMTVILYTRQLESLLMNSTLFFTGFYLLYKALRRIELCESGVYIVRRKIDWHSIKSYKWAEFSKNSKFYSLTLHRKPETKKEKIFNSSHEIKLHIDTRDKEKVDLLLEKINDAKALAL